MHEHFDLIIVGAGPAGLTAAIYARRAGRSVLVLERSSIGGQIASAPRWKTTPGFSAISGAELAERLYTQAEDLGARIELETVTSIVPGPAHTVTTDYGTYTAAAVILATGTVTAPWGSPGEDILSGHLLLCRLRRRILPGAGCGRMRRRQLRPSGIPFSSPTCAAM